MSLKILHFSDAHIDMANYGRHDPETGLPVRVLDFLKSLDEIVDTAISEKVDLVIFAGDAYKDRNPAPTFQREWGRRMMRLSRADIPTLLLTGNHDVSPSLGRAHALEEYSTLEIPFVRVLSKPELLGPQDLWDLPVQVIALPWVSKSQMLAYGNVESAKSEEIYGHLEGLLAGLVDQFMEQVDPSLPLLMLAHASVQGASYGGERSVMLGNEIVLSGSLVKDPRLDYVALGHIHKHQNLNEGQQPPVIYPGSIERVDFGEAHEEKYYVVATVEKGNTQVEWRQLKHIRKFIDLPPVKLESPDGVMKLLKGKMPTKAELKDAVVRLTIDYPRELEPFIDEAALREAAADTFEFHLVKRPQIEARNRMAQVDNVNDLSPSELLDYYWDSAGVDKPDRKPLADLAQEIIQEIPSEE